MKWKVLNPYQMDVTYRGFNASPITGSAVGMSVYFDGIRFNEPFGDIVNWDLIPCLLYTSDAATKA